MPGRKGRNPAALITHLVEIGVAVLADQLGIPEHQARQAMRNIAHQLANDYGRTYMYIPMDNEFVLDKRDLQIYERLERGSTVTDVARDFELTARQVYNVAQHVRERVAVKRQNDLPGFDS